MNHEVGQGPEVKTLITISKKIERLIAVLASSVDGSTLQSVTDAGNTTTNNMVVWDSSSLPTAITSLSPGEMSVYAIGSDSVLGLSATQGPLPVLTGAIGSTSSSMTFDLLSNVTTNRVISLPDNDGIVALISDVAATDLQSVTDAGNTTTNDMVINLTSFIDEGLTVHWDHNVGIADTIIRPEGPNVFSGPYDTRYAGQYIQTRNNSQEVFRIDHEDKFIRFTDGVRSAKFDMLALPTGNRTLSFPNKDGTIATLSDIPALPGTPNLQEVTDEGSVTTNNITANNITASAFIGNGELITEVTKWKGTWGITSYKKDDIVVDGIWTMVANKDTSERAAPEEVSRGWFVDTDTTWTSPTTDDTIITGTKLTISPNYAINISAYRVYLPESSTDVDYTMGVFDVTTGQTVIDDFFIPAGFGPGTWFTREIVPAFFPASTELIIVLRATKTATNLITDGRWNFFFDDRAPGTGEIAVNQTEGGKDEQYANYIRINQTDLDAGNINGSLITVGSTVKMIAADNTNNAQYWTITGSGVPTGNYYEYAAELTASDGGLNDGEEVSVTIDLPGVIPVIHSEDVGGWAGVVFLGALFEGVKGPSIEGLVVDTTIYGADGSGARFTMPVDWDIMATSGTSGTAIITDEPLQGLDSVTVVGNSTPLAILSTAVVTNDSQLVNRGWINDQEFVEEAPNDGQDYLRKNQGWVVAPAGGISHAPSDNNLYASSNGAWEIFDISGIATNASAIASLDLQAVTDIGSGTTNDITANAFIGDGSQLTNIPLPSNIAYTDAENIFTKKQKFYSYNIFGGDSNDSPYGTMYMWRFGNTGTGGGSVWYKICDVIISDGNFKAQSLHVKHILPGSNHGSSAFCKEREYSVTMRGGIQYDDAYVVGPETEFIRVVKTSKNNFELQAKTGLDNTSFMVSYMNTGGAGTVLPAQTIEAGSTTGDIYTSNESGNTYKKFGGDIFAAGFVGDGSRLTNIAQGNLPSNVAYTDAANEFTNNNGVTVSGTAPRVTLIETDEADKPWYVIADGGAFSIRETNIATTRFRIDVGGEVIVPGKFRAVDSINSSTALLLDGVNINTAGTLTNVAYKNQSNVFTEPQTISTSGGTGASTALSLYNTFNNSLNRNWLIGLNVHAYGDFTVRTSSVKDGTPNTTRLLINNLGNVGIGTTIPTEKLEVNGNVKATAFIGDGSQLTNLPAQTLPSNLAYTNIDNNFSTTQTFKDRVVIESNNSTNNVLTLVSNLDKTMMFVATNVQSTYLYLKNNLEENKILFNTAGNSYFAGGNVGIGTTAPTKTLDVNGSVKATEFVGDGSLLTGITYGQIGGTPNLNNVAYKNINNFFSATQTFGSANTEGIRLEPISGTNVNMYMTFYRDSAGSRNGYIQALGTGLAIKSDQGYTIIGGLTGASLRHNSSTKLITTSTGVDVTGILDVTGNVETSGSFVGDGSQLTNIPGISDKVSNSADSFAGTSKVTQMVTLSQAEYDGITPDANTLYIIL